MAKKDDHVIANQKPKCFLGFEPLHSNYVFCPNQFFDICLRSSSRGMIRSVAFILRQTLGWLDEAGLPVNQTVRVPYRRLQLEANVSERAIPKAIQLAIACGFIKCIVNPVRDQKNLVGSAGEYTLNWDESETFVKTLTEFNGFYTGEGHRSPIPNSFFDTVIPNESLSVTKVVGAVLRNTIGYENQYGGRRLTYPLSCTTLQKLTGISDRKTIIAAIRRSIEAGYIERVEDGQFHPDRNVRTAAVYGIKWLPKPLGKPTTAKTPPASSHRNNPTSTSAKNPPTNLRKNPTSIEKTKVNNISKQQAAADLEFQTRRNLMAEGFDEATANELTEKRGIEVAQKQLEWIDARAPKNRPAMLRKAITEDWAEPASFSAKQKINNSRKRDEARAATLKLDEEVSNRQKAQRLKRRDRLLVEWENAEQSQRSIWIAAAAERQTATSLQQIIAREKPTSGNPKFQVLDEIAFDLSLQPVSEPNETASFESQQTPTSVVEQPPTNQEMRGSCLEPLDEQTPQKEKTSTNLATF
jgi:hypothetical protein